MRLSLRSFALGLSLVVASACSDVAAPERPSAAESALLSTPSFPLFVVPDVLTQRGDNGRTGASFVPGMNAAAIAGEHWGKIGQLTVQGTIYAQPLFTAFLKMPDGAFRDVIYVATALNHVHAFDASTREEIWPHIEFAGPDRRDESFVLANG
jgi:hypothetical protein